MHVLSIQQQQCIVTIPVKVKKDKHTVTLMNRLKIFFVVLFTAWPTWSQWTVSVIELKVIVLRFFRIFILCSLEEINRDFEYHEEGYTLYYNEDY